MNTSVAPLRTGSITRLLVMALCCAVSVSGVAAFAQTAKAGAKNFRYNRF